MPFPTDKLQQAILGEKGLVMARKEGKPGHNSTYIERADVPGVHLTHAMLLLEERSGSSIYELIGEGTLQDVVARCSWFGVKLDRSTVSKWRVRLGLVDAEGA